MKLLFSVLLSVVIFAFSTKGDAGIRVDEFKGRKVVQGFIKFETEVKNLDSVCNNLNNGNDIRKFEANINLQKAKDNVYQFKLLNEQLIKLKNIVSSYKNSLKAIYDDFKKTHDAEIIKRKKTANLLKLLNVYSARFDKEISQVAKKLDNELESRTGYVIKLASILKTPKAKLNPIINQNVLNFDGGIALEIRKELVTLSTTVPKQIKEIEGFFSENLAANLKK